MSRKLFEGLVKVHYIIYFNGQLVVTNKFYRDFKLPPEPEPETAVVVVQEAPKSKEIMLPDVMNSALTVQAPTPGVSPLHKFIKDCQIPEKAKTADGFYRLNQFSSPAEKALIKILSNGYKYDILVAATKLYYKSSGNYPKNVTNYLVDGIWQGGYEDMVTSLENGTVNQHIKSQLDNSKEEDGHTRYKR